ncbi:hypothetical protein ACS0TY_035160 [Phlomoides rotata]
MAANFSIRSSNFCNPKAVISSERFDSKFDSPSASKINVKEPKRLKLGRNALPMRFLKRYVSKSRVPFSKWSTPRALSSMAANSDFSIDEDYSSPRSPETDGNRVDYLVRILHESARSFSDAMHKVELAGIGSPLAMAWNGVDVHAWHKRIAYPVAAYALLKAAIEVELFLSHNRSNPSPVNEILSPCTHFLLVNIESELHERNPKLVQWFHTVELPRLAGFFMPLLKRWSADYAGSGIAGTIMGITCAVSVGKLSSGRISCSLYSDSIDRALAELMTMAHDLVSLDNLHHLAIEAGFEQDFLSHFGSKVLPSKNSEALEFWIGLVHRKLSVALERESVIKGRHNISDKVQGSSLSTLALFAYLGRQSRLFLSKQNIKEADEQITKFLSYLECGILFIYPEFSTISAYQLLMEVVIDEICWLDLFAVYYCNLWQGRRSKNQPIQAEKEIIFYTVFTICYDVISAFAHYTSSTQQSLDPHVLEFLLQSQGLLSACLVEYWATYDRTGDLPKIGEKSGSDSAPSFLRIREKMQKRASSQTEATSSSGNQVETLSDSDHISKSKPVNFLKKSVKKLVAASVDVLMGTQLLFVDISDFVRFLGKKCCGHKITEREGRKMQTTLCDLATLIPVTILMLLPVSAVGHAAMFTAIKRYVPCLIPSPYSDERVNLVKQLKRTKKMELQRVNVEEDSISEAAL